MRLWHQGLIPYLDRERLLGQHRECCALRGKGWGKKHATVDYVFKYEPCYLFLFHQFVLDEMYRRNYKIDRNWRHYRYRGKTLGVDDSLPHIYGWDKRCYTDTIYPEHDRAYLLECIDLLKKKNAPIDFERLEKELNIKGEK